MEPQNAFFVFVMPHAAKPSDLVGLGVVGTRALGKYRDCCGCLNKGTYCARVHVHTCSRACTRADTLTYSLAGNNYCSNAVEPAIQGQWRCKMALPALRQEHQPGHHKRLVLRGKPPIASTAPPGWHPTMLPCLQWFRHHKNPSLVETQYYLFSSIQIHKRKTGIT